MRAVKSGTLVSEHSTAITNPKEIDVRIFFFFTGDTSTPSEAQWFTTSVMSVCVCGGGGVGGGVWGGGGGAVRKIGVV